MRFGEPAPVYHICGCIKLRIVCQKQEDIQFHTGQGILSKHPLQTLIIQTFNQGQSIPKFRIHRVSSVRIGFGSSAKRGNSKPFQPDFAKFRPGSSQSIVVLF